MHNFTKLAALLQALENHRLVRDSPEAAEAEARP